MIHTFCETSPYLPVRAHVWRMSARLSARVALYCN